MACYSPLKGYLSRTTNDSGKRSIVFNAKQGFIDKPMDVPCGQCIGCRLERSRQWAMRCIHENQLHKKSCFITLTYNREHLPKSGSLDKKHFQLFIDRLRKSIAPRRIRYFHCGEYGENLGRPHYHAILFGYTPKDQELLKEAGGIRLYTSRSLESIWGKGFVTIGEVTFESAAYVARYVTKKVTGSKAKNYYKALQPEYVTMSRRPGIGKGWFNKYKDDIYPKDFTTIRGRKCKPAKFYDKQLEATDPQSYESIKTARKIKSKEMSLDNTPERLHVKETVTKSKLNQTKRSYENDL